MTQISQTDCLAVLKALGDKEKLPKTLETLKSLLAREQNLAVFAKNGLLSALAACLKQQGADPKPKCLVLRIAVPLLRHPLFEASLPWEATGFVQFVILELAEIRDDVQYFEKNIRGNPAAVVGIFQRVPKQLSDVWKEFEMEVCDAR
jgi:hypothetical protein